MRLGRTIESNFRADILPTFLDVSVTPLGITKSHYDFRLVEVQGSRGKPFIPRRRHASIVVGGNMTFVTKLLQMFYRMDAVQ